MEGLKEFLESSTIHGLAHISTNRGLVRFLWLFVVLIGFSGAGILIHQSFSSWAASPISTTIETVPISDLDFPNVTVCPPKKSFTSLNPDLVMSKNMTFDLKKRHEVAASIVDTVFFANYEPKYKEFLEYRGQQKLIDLYSGVSKINLPRHVQPGNGVTYRTYEYDTQALSGSISTPYFRKPFDNNTFELTLIMQAFIYVPDKIPKGSKIVLDFEYDMEQISHNEYFWIKQFDQNKNGHLTAATQMTTWTNDDYWNEGSLRKEYYVGESTDGKM